MLHRRLSKVLACAVTLVLPAFGPAWSESLHKMQIGATVMDSRIPSKDQGCYNDAAAYGANTYWWDEATLKAHFTGHPPRSYTKAQYDEKPMNCGAYWMYAAFCSWDGGRMPTQAEVNQAYGTTSYPWGTTTFSYPFSTPGAANDYELTANYFNNRSATATRTAGYFYHFPGYGTADEMAGYIAAPGRFILDKTAAQSANGERWMDLGANVMEIIKTAGTGTGRFCDFAITNGPGDVPDAVNCIDGAATGVSRATNMPSAGWVGGSWEGHWKFKIDPADEPFFTKNSYNLPLHTQYGKTGFRCVR